MKRLARDIRLIPVLMVAIGCLAVLKVSGLLLDGGYVLSDDGGVPPKKSWAQETFNFPAPGRQSEPLDITGSVHGGKKEEKKEEKPEVAAPEARSPDQTVVFPDPKGQIPPSERAVLESLQSRRQEIEARAREIDIRESLIKSAEQRVEGRLEEVKATEARISAVGQQKNEADAARFKGIITMYEGMKPKDAAKVFDRLELPVLFEIASQIAPRKMADIMGQMQPEAAERLTVELARRASGGLSSSPNDLPKIDGKPSQPARN